MTEYAKEIPTQLRDFERLPVERLLVVLGGFAGIGLAVLSFMLDITHGPFARAIGGASGPVMMLVLTLLFSVLLIYAYIEMGRNESQGAVLAVAFGLVLILFGGIAGAVAGILGIVGALVVILRHVKWTA